MFRGVKIILLILIVFLACTKKQTSNPSDLRDKIVGNYKGYEFNTTWSGTVFVTSPAYASTISITKSANNDSIVYFVYGNTYEYKYSLGLFSAHGNNYHPPLLTVSADDSLHYTFAPALGPLAYHGTVKKQ